ncbi:MAG: stage V sporulation protein AB [Lachnospiraceae bacterium]|nr:stage V sporulation protein AB [Lachnospiraceae bacterium]
MQSLGIGILGLFCGLMVSGGVFTALLALGLVPRFAGKTHTANHILTYESAVVSGCIIGGLFGVLQIKDYLEVFLYGFSFFQSRIWEVLTGGLLTGGGFFSGCFVGCVALAIAEMLDSIPIFSRRISFRRGVGVAVLVVAIGKVVGSLIYFALTS